MKLFSERIDSRVRSVGQLGFTLAELIIGIALASVVLGLTYTVVASNRNLYVRDRARIDANQNVRSAIDLIGADIRQAGELTPDRTFPTIVVLDNPAGDTLIIRRNLEQTTLPVCNDVANGTNSIVIALPDTSEGACSRVGRDADPSGILPDNLFTWQTIREEADGDQITAFIFDGDNNPLDGEFFTYSNETRVPESLPATPETPSTYSITTTDSSWTNNYSPGDADLPVLALIEQRSYVLDGNGNINLQIVDTEGVGAILPVVNSITNFQVDVVLQDGTVLSSFGPGDDWSQIASIQVSITGTSQATATETAQQTVTANFLPRNVLSFTLN